MDAFSDLAFFNLLVKHGGLAAAQELGVTPSAASKRLAALERRLGVQPPLTEWSLPGADIHAVFPTRSHLSAKTRALVDFLLEWFRPRREAAEAGRPAW